MKTKAVPLNKLRKIYKNPAIVLFRWLELNAIHTEVKRINIVFKKPSLDLGCGNGDIASILFNKKFTFGLDNNEAGDVQDAIDMNRYESVIIESAENISLKPSCVNFIFSNSVIEHIPKINAVLESVSRILKKDGYFVFTVPSADFSKHLFVSSLLNKIGMRQLANKYVSYRNTKLNHYHLYMHSKWIRMLKNHKFNIIAHRYYISPKNLQLWDFAAISFKLLSFLIHKEIIWKLFEPSIKQAIKKDKSVTDKGSGLVIIAQKK